jgi:hypothetical protein
MVWHKQILMSSIGRKNKQFLVSKIKNSFLYQALILSAYGMKKSQSRFFAIFNTVFLSIFPVTVTVWRPTFLIVPQRD